MSNNHIDNKLDFLTGEPSVDNSLIDKRIQEYNKEVTDNKVYRDRLNALLEAVQENEDGTKDESSTTDKLQKLLDDYNSKNESSNDYTKEFEVETKLNYN